MCKASVVRLTFTRAIVCNLPGRGRFVRLALLDSMHTLHACEAAWLLYCNAWLASVTARVLIKHKHSEVVQQLLATWRSWLCQAFYKPLLMYPLARQSY